MSDDEKEQTIQEEDEHGNILIYPAWSKKNAPKRKPEQLGSADLSLKILKF